MKVGDLVAIVWTEGCETPPVIGVITDFCESQHYSELSRQKVELFSSGKRSWFERGDLRVVV
jgi:hypothetical protein